MLQSVRPVVRSICTIRSQTQLDSVCDCDGFRMGLSAKITGELFPSAMVLVDPSDEGDGMEDVGEDDEAAETIVEG